MSKNIRGSKRKPKRVAIGEPSVGKGEALYYLFLWSMLLPLFAVIYLESVYMYGIGFILGSWIVMLGAYLFLKHQ
jgi:hypothetical protein